VELPVGAIEFLDPKLRQKGLLKASGKVELVAESLGEIRVKGHVAAAIEADCDRCLEPAPYPIDADFEAVLPAPGRWVRRRSEARRGRGGNGVYEGDGVELNDALREYVLLALPMQRLCSETCKGICPVCGQNRNQNQCQCRSAAVDDRWAALKQLK